MARCSPGFATKRLNSVWPRAHDRYPEHERTSPRAAVRIDPVPPSGWWATCQASLGASSYDVPRSPPCLKPGARGEIRPATPHEEPRRLRGHSAARPPGARTWEGEHSTTSPSARPAFGSSTARPIGERSGRPGSAPAGGVDAVRNLLRAYTIVGDDRNVAKVRRGETVDVEVVPGTHTVRATIDRCFWSTPTLHLELADGELAELPVRPEGVCPSDQQTQLRAGMARRNRTNTVTGRGGGSACLCRQIDPWQELLGRLSTHTVLRRAS
jgi:hypothetical protein